MCLHWSVVFWWSMTHEWNDIIANQSPQSRSTRLTKFRSLVRITRKLMPAQVKRRLAGWTTTATEQPTDKQVKQLTIGVDRKFTGGPRDIYKNHTIFIRNSHRIFPKWVSFSSTSKLVANERATLVTIINIMIFVISLIEKCAWSRTKYSITSKVLLLQPSCCILHSVCWTIP